MKDLNIEFPLDDFEELINQIGWSSLDEWFMFWNLKKDILSNHLPKVVFPVPGKADIPIMLRLEDFLFNLYACDKRGKANPQIQSSLTLSSQNSSIESISFLRFQYINHSSNVLHPI